ncbi:hypothetical protein J31TS4_37650 [Paenibacillus sp. J31TS4]|uniref:hypothetical protein n=1 Tax=Paenibacillus sp. J31TS4 TaxID=2807195 RepID=UPI001B1D9444|nr:hypothetical protein [Paenibacillus sp. J31TS4]GIP40485.1 hypothetical protein J31TS4_37650 [Paenibacillus sp. J31TS4]
MERYRLVTTWKLEAAREEIWELLTGRPERNEWKGVTIRRLAGEGPAAIGTRYESVFRTRLGYKLAFLSTIVRMERPALLEIRASGHLEGTGSCSLTQEGDATVLRYEWEVCTKKRWMNALAPLLRPAFLWNHEQVMQEGAAALSRRLGVRLVSLAPGLTAGRPNG